MRKCAVLAVVLAAAAALGAQCGCGEAADVARNHMSRGDALLETVQKKYAVVSTKAARLIADYSGGKNTGPSGVRARIDEISALLDESGAAAGAASAQYEKVMSMKGVPGYVKCAALRNESALGLEKANRYVRSMLGVIELSSATGRAPDTRRLAAIGASLRKLSEDIDRLAGEANELQEREGLR